jgi:hypothetical protein
MSCDLIPNVKPVEIDVIGAKPLQARFHGLHHVFALVTARIGIFAAIGPSPVGRTGTASLPVLADFHLLLKSVRPGHSKQGAMLGRIPKSRPDPHKIASRPVVNGFGPV